MEANAADVQSTPENDVVQRLQQEVAALRAEIQTLRSTAQLQASQPTTQAGHEQTFDFMRLPRELRNLVYEFCVVVGEVRIGNHDNWAQYPDMRYIHREGAKAETSLFAVNKQIRVEALELYLSKNHFVVPSTAMWTSDGSCAGYWHHISGRPGISAVHKHVRSISMPFDFWSLMDEDGGKDSINFHTAVETNDEVNFAMERHNDFAFWLCHSFIDILADIPLGYPQLRKLQINLQNATCRLGCHRLVVAIFTDADTKKRLEHYWRIAENARLIESLEFLGTINGEERRAIRSAFPHFLRSKVTFRGQIDPTWGLWDPDVEILDETSSEHDAPGSSLKDSSSE
jgi:hypothetical protein